MNLYLHSLFYRPIFNIYRLFCRILLKVYYSIKTVGVEVSFFSGFKVYNSKNIKIGSNVYLTDVLLSAGNTEKGSITIGDNVFFGHRVMVLARSHNYTKISTERANTIVEKQIVIKEGAWIASGSIILAGVTIGKNAVVGAGSVVTKDVDDNSLFAGNPAKFIKKISV